MTTISNRTMMTLAEMNWIEKLWLRAPESTAGPTAGETDAMFMWLWWFCVAWFVALMTLMVYFVVKYRRRPGRIAPWSPAHNTTVELAWTIIPSLFLVYIFFRGFHGYMGKVVAPGGAVELSLTGYKWNWEMTYPTGVKVDASTYNKTIGARPVPVFYVPGDTTVRLRMNSRDVMHAFWIPDMRIKSDLVPNRYTGLFFKPKGPEQGSRRHPASKEEARESGKNPDNIPFIDAMAGVPYSDHWVFCAEYCGEEHSEMAAIIRVVPKEAFAVWLRDAAEGGDVPPVEKGKRIYAAKCASCHSNDGSGNTGPTWKNLFGSQRNFADGSSTTADENYIVQSIRYPAKQIVAGFQNQMTPWPEDLLPQKNVDAIIAYMKSISDKGGVIDIAPAPPTSDKSAPTPANDPTPKPH
jgi:cytochrome c oxidase subunit 2